MDNLPEEAFGDDFELYDIYAGGKGTNYEDDNDKDELEQDYDAENDDEADYQAEAKAFERVGPGGRMSELLQSTSGDQKLSNPSMSQEDRFIILVDAKAREINSQRIAVISDADIEILRNSTQKISGLKYKNYLAYILGYLASSGGRDMKNVKNVIQKILPKLHKEAGVYPEDVVRYARYWNLFLL